MQVVPISSNISRLFPSEAFVNVGNRQGKALADQITTVSKLRLKERIGEVTLTDMAGIEAALKTHLQL
ncbi:MAG: hypothetical protein A2324_05560 [Candidatus Raymondbacteria bacterium RIFOXYB2_FULL_49_35]|uniref:Growth inhibitor PemK n=1 Tax=Candidatus Raymondbacteria bacterium RIFOXYD12_FULL_49_13 TaxID=1817890 RepID=A0A1F7F701_UNCRA|nr:MAG: hypothetical protein A2519_15870 [Candidatus Raymondbacteria bacterium RIFOXYD12_FULL_49_13]OGP41462.1 MAG: hypothetical protein A2324_05560 [Candidatus Raymondbacteria bacterium RIFOXYB2_FULL_49_35]